MAAVQTWSSSETKGSYSKVQTRVTTAASLGHDEGRAERGCLSWAASVGHSSKGWKPLSMSTPILSALVVLTLLIAAAIEILAQRSAQYGGLALSPSLDAIPRYAMWSYLYGPNVLAVLYSLIWSWVDLDVKRMQPWFELSREGGATAEESLFLDYPYDFVAVAPWKAFKRRHWPVVLAGTTMMTVFWAITPLQSAILGTGVISVIEPATIYMGSQLMPAEQQVDVLDPQFLNDGYAVGWLNQSMPPFTTKDYSYLPFYVNDTRIRSRDMNWTAVTTRYSTDLECKPVVGTQHVSTPTTWDFINDRGCNATINLSAFANYTMLYIGYYTSAFSDFALGGPQCPPSTNSTHQFLAIWAKTIPGDEIGEAEWNITAAFCETQYWKEDVRLTISSQAHMPLGSAEPMSSRERLEDDEFNRTAFEFLLGNGMPENPIPRDLPFSQVVEQSPRLDDTDIHLPISNMVGYALAGHILPTEDYSNLQVMQRAYRRAHRYLFSLAVRQLLSNDTTAFESRTANLTFVQTGITVSRAFSATVESLLIVVAISTATLAWLVHSAQSNLPQNPSSILRIGTLLKEDRAFMNRLQAVDNADDESLARNLNESRLKLVRTIEQSGEVSARLVSFNSWNPQHIGQDQELSRAKFYKPIRPIALRRWSGLLFVTSIAGALAGLSYLKAEEMNSRGLVRPSSNFEVLQILENYVPTAFATLTEPFWVLLTRLLCMLQPFRDLWKGHATAKRTIQSTYTAIPPQVVAWRALKSRHLLLVLLCMMVLLSNLLAVGLGALFNEAPVIIPYEKSFRPQYAAKFDNTSVTEFDRYLSERITTSSFYQDHMYVALANYTSSTPLPPWTSREFFFQPHELHEESQKDSKADSYSVITRGFGASGNCRAWPKSSVPVVMSDIPALASNSTECPNFIEAVQSQIRLSTFTRPSGRSAIEQIAAYVSPTIVNNCGLPLNMAFGRTPDGQDMNGTIEASYTICRPSFQTAMFNVTVDTSGVVISATRIGDLANALDYKDSELHQQLLIHKATELVASSLPQWHNDTLSRNWMTYFLTVLTDSRAFLDPNEPVPDLEPLKPAIESIYRTLFAIMLSLNQHLFEGYGRSGEPSEATSNGVEFAPEVRIFMDESAFIVSMIVLVLNIIVASFFYLRTTAFVLPRMPSTIASIMAYVAPSQGLWDRKYSDDKQTYSFGRFLGRDGQVHLGIEADPHVALIEPASLKSGQHALSRILRLRRAGDKKPDGPWL